MTLEVRGGAVMQAMAIITIISEMTFGMSLEGTGKHGKVGTLKEWILW